MSRFREELRVIPRKGWLVAIVLYLALVLVMTIVVRIHSEFRTWPLHERIPFVVGVPLLLPIYVLVVGYVYSDARRRQMRYVLWTFLAAFIPYAIGLILYFILRDPLPIPCPSCAMPAPASYVFCPHCGTAVSPSCPHCGKSVQRGWSNCAYCGTKLA